MTYPANSHAVIFIIHDGFHFNKKCSKGGFVIGKVATGWLLVVGKDSRGEGLSLMGLSW